MKVGVLMPCRTPLAYTKAAVESVLAQTHSDWEMVIINDDAPAETAEYLRELAAKDARVRIINHAQAAGLAKSLNEGLESLTNEVVLRMDADDIACPERFARQVAYMAQHPDVTVLGSQIEFIDERGEPVAKKNSVPLPHGRIAYQLLWSSALNHPTVAYRRAAVLASGAYNSKFDTCEDYQLWTRMIEKYQFANLPEALLRYRVHAQQSTKTDPLLAQKIQRSRLAYRAELTGLPEAACDELASPKDWAGREEFYKRVAAKFSGGRYRRDLARRILRELQADGRKSSGWQAAERLSFELHWPTALIKKIFGGRA